MKLIYGDTNIANEIKEFVLKIKADIELRKDLESVLNDFKQAHKGKAIGCPIPDSFVDLGKYLFSLFLGALGSGATYDLMKIAIKNLLFNSKNKTSKKFDYFLISDGDDPGKYEENIYFYLPVALTELEVNECMEEIRKIINIVNDLKDLTYLADSLRFYYVNGAMRSYRGNKLFTLKGIVRSL